MEARSDVVVVQSPWFRGGNLRQWARGKDTEARLRAAQGVAEAVRFLHAHTPPILHRDLKPENVVLDSDSPAARPALCDFDFSVNSCETMTSARMLGTLLYLSPDATPTAASDVFSLGMTLLDIVFCDADDDRLRQLVLVRGRAVADLDDIARVRSELDRRTDNAELAQLVSSMLAPAPADRPGASEVAQALSELLDVRTCVLCHCPEPRDKGLECSAAPPHFACNECFSSHVSRFESLCKDDCNRGRVKCCAEQAGCPATFTLQEAAKHASPLAFEALQTHTDDLNKIVMQQEKEQEIERWKASYLAKSEQERRVIAVRKHIEELMDLRCPKCGMVFGEYTGCAALTCAYAGCNAHFCALCLKDCGQDAHPHVRTCPLNPKQNEYYVSADVWAGIVSKQRRDKLEQYWESLEAEVKNELAKDASVAQIFRDLKLDRLMGAAGYSEQMAQLRGMGFKDERAMRRALAEAAGDIEAALERL